MCPRQVQTLFKCHFSSRFILEQRRVYMEKWQLQALFTQVIFNEF